MFLSWLQFELEITLWFSSSKSGMRIGSYKKAKKWAPAQNSNDALSFSYHPYISYGPLPWTSSFVSSFQKIQFLRHKVFRVLRDYVRFEDSTLSWFIKLKIINVYRLKYYKLANFAYECLNCYSLECFGDFFESNSFYDCYETRHF